VIKVVVSLFLLGFSFGAGPCLASCGPLLISYLVGTNKNVARGIISYLLFSAARIATYILLGVCVFLLGRFIMTELVGMAAKYLLIAAGAIILLIGVVMIAGKGRGGPFCGFLHKHMLEKDNKSVLILGIVIGLLPCAPLIALFSYIGLVSKTIAHSVLYSIVFGLGTAISPLLILVIFSGLVPKLTAARERFSRIVTIVSGSVIIIMGLQLLWRAF
jgi:sulfite exporter TauE/SafE